MLTTPLYRMFGACAGLLIVALLPGCAPAALTTPLPPGLTLTSLTRMEPGSPFAWHPSGERISTVTDALIDIDLASGEKTVLSRDKPLALAWSPDGRRLAAAYGDSEQSRLALLSAVGTVLGETTVAGRLERLIWDGDEAVLAVAVKIRGYSFGGHLSATLLRWVGEGAPAETLLYETTVKPLTLRTWGELLYAAPQPALSPRGDELLFSRLHDPPAFAPYLKLVVRHLASGAERVAANVVMTSAGGIFLGDGETLLYGDGAISSHVAYAWAEGTTADYPRGGASLAASPGGRYRLVDGHFFDGDGEIALLPADRRAAFSPAGDRLLFASEGRLFLLAGMAADPLPALDPILRGRLLQLRSWRARGLIAEGEYREQKGRVMGGDPVDGGGGRSER